MFDQYEKHIEGLRELRFKILERSINEGEVLVFNSETRSLDEVTSICRNGPAFQLNICEPDHQVRIE